MRGKEKEREESYENSRLGTGERETGNDENLAGHIFLRMSRRERQDDTFAKKNSAKDVRYSQPSGRVNLIQIPNTLFNDSRAQVDRIACARVNPQWK